MSSTPSHTSSHGAPPTAAPAAPYPLPALPSSFELPTKILKSPVLHRVYWEGVDALAPSVGTMGNRYDCLPPPAPQFGVLYTAETLEACWLETVLRKRLVRPAGKAIKLNTKDVAARMACEIHVTGDLRVVDFTDFGLLSLGEIASNTMSDDYERTHIWAQLLHAHSLPEVSAIRYRSRIKNNVFCLAIFDRAFTRSSGLSFSVKRQRSMDPTRSVEALRILNRYNVEVALDSLA